MGKFGDSESGCCPRFDPGPWDEKEVVLDQRLFVKDRVRCFLHVPIGFGRVMVRNMEKIMAAGAIADESLMLCDESSPWAMDIYIAVSKDVPNSENVRVSGTFLTKVFEGPYRDCRKWVRTMADYVAGKGKELKKMYTFYTTCPKCAKFYGKNYVVLLGQV